MAEMKKTLEKVIDQLTVENLRLTAENAVLKKQLENKQNGQRPKNSFFNIINAQKTRK